MDYKKFYTTVAEQMEMNKLLSGNEGIGSFSIENDSIRIKFSINDIFPNCYYAEISRNDKISNNEILFTVCGLKLMTDDEFSYFCYIDKLDALVKNENFIVRRSCGNRYFYHDGKFLVNAVLRGRDAQGLWNR